MTPEQIQKLRELWFNRFKTDYDDYPSQDNEGYIPERGSFKCGHSCGWDSAIKLMKPLIEALGLYSKDIMLSVDGEPDGGTGWTAKIALEKFFGEEK